MCPLAREPKRVTVTGDQFKSEDGKTGFPTLDGVHFCLPTRVSRWTVGVATCVMRKLEHDLESPKLRSGKRI